MFPSVGREGCPASHHVWLLCVVVSKLVPDLPFTAPQDLMPAIVWRDRLFDYLLDFGVAFRASNVDYLNVYFVDSPLSAVCRPSGVWGLVRGFAVLGPSNASDMRAANRYQANGVMLTREHHKNVSPYPPEAGLWTAPSSLQPALNDLVTKRPDMTADDAALMKTPLHLKRLHHQGARLMPHDLTPLTLRRTSEACVVGAEFPLLTPVVSWRCRGAGWRLGRRSTTPTTPTSCPSCPQRASSQRPTGGPHPPTALGGQCRCPVDHNSCVEPPPWTSDPPSGLRWRLEGFHSEVRTTMTILRWRQSPHAIPRASKSAVSRPPPAAAPTTPSSRPRRCPPRRASGPTRPIGMPPSRLRWTPSGPPLANSKGSMSRYKGDKIHR
jgi:hypothetical protein